jgi:hypothetical protein
MGDHEGLAGVRQTEQTPPVQPTTGTDLHERLADLWRGYNVNDYAASVRVFAVKPR